MLLNLLFNYNEKPNDNLCKENTINQLSIKKPKAKKNQNQLKEIYETCY